MLNTQFLPFSSEDLKVTAVGLTPGKATGPGSIPPEVMRYEIASQKTGTPTRNVKPLRHTAFFPKYGRNNRLVLITEGKGDP